MLRDLVYQENEYMISGFINSNHEFEFNICKHTDGGFLDLEDREYKEEELLYLLSIELESYIDKRKASTIILGHDIRIVTSNGELIPHIELGDEVYEVSQAILDGCDAGEVFINGKIKKVFWEIVV